MTNTIAIQAQIDQLADERTAVQAKADSAQKGYKAAMWGILIGVFGLLFYGLGALILLIAIPAAVTQGAKKARAQSKVNSLNDEIKALRAQLATGGGEG
jgi:uncharacterized protein YlxW (UPF0749 family)